MQSKNRRISLLLRAALFLLCALLLSAVAAAADYSDVSGHWAEDTITRWSDRGVLKGYDDGTFRPNEPVTRGQLAEILYRLLHYPASEGYDFVDLPKDSWCYESLTTMNLYSVAVNTGDHIYPNEAITRGEACHMICQAFHLSNANWSATRERAFEEQMKNLKTRGSIEHRTYIQGDADGQLHPERKITRAEVLTILDRIADYWIDEPGVYEIPFKKDVAVTCGGVTLKYVRTPTTPATDRTGLMGTFHSNGYLLFEAAEQGVTLCADEPYHVDFCGISRTKPQITEEGRMYAVGKDISVYDKPINPIEPLRTELFAAGHGTKLFPYLIQTPEQFLNLLKFTDNHFEYRYFLLNNDITLPALSEPLGLEGEQTVYAYLDGGGHTITYQLQNDAYDLPVASLFYQWHGGLENLTLRGTVDLTLDDDAWYTASEGDAASGNKVFAFGGFVVNACNMTNCTAEMDVTIRAKGDDLCSIYAGGLTATARSRVLSGCTAAGAIRVLYEDDHGEAFVGGLVGAAGSNQISGAWFEDCGATGTYSTQGGYHTLVGGLTGLQSSITSQTAGPLLDYPKMENCWSTATLSADGASLECDVGGLVGQLYSGSLASCWAKPAITTGGSAAYQNIGALAGKAEAQSTISDCWANAAGCDAAALRHTGGLVGRLLGRVSDCYVVGCEAFAAENAFAYADWNDGAVVNCLNLTGVAAEPRQALLDGSGWDFAETWDRSGPYPILTQCDAALQRSAQP